MSQAVQESDLNAPTDQEVAFRESMGRLTELLRGGMSISGHERNCCFLNTGTPRFASVASTAGLDSSGDGRAYGLVDWDHDGDLDLWATCRTDPRVQFLRNNSEDGMHFLSLRLQGNGTTTNRDAIGARVELILEEPGELKSIKTLHAGDGFLSQSSKWVHFGLGQQRRIEHVKVHWPGGSLETFTGLQADGHYSLVQGNGVAQPWARPAPSKQWQASKTKQPKVSDQARIPLKARIPLPAFHYETMQGKRVPLVKDSGSPTLVTLWASWCQPCLMELADFEKHHEQIADTGLTIVALSVDELAKTKSSSPKTARALIEKKQYRFKTGMATEKLVGKFESVLYFLFEHRRSWAVPTSFLIDGRGKLSVIYVGRVEVDQLIADVNNLRLGDPQWLAAALPIEGRWSGASGYPNLVFLAKAFLDDGYEEAAIDYVDRHGNSMLSNTRLPKLLIRIGDYLLGKKTLDSKPSLDTSKSNTKARTAMEYYQAATRLDPKNSNAPFAVASQYEKLKQWNEAERYFLLSIAANPDSTGSRIQLALTLVQLDRKREAIPHLQRAIKIDPTLAGPHYHLAAIQMESDQLEDAIEHFRLAYQLEPENIATINGLAWTLAIKPNSTKQETTEAVHLGEIAAEMTKNRHPQILDTLGAAYAADGQFEKAEKTAKRAVQLAVQAGSEALAAEIRGRVEQYQQKHPVRESHSRE